MFTLFLVILPNFFIKRHNYIKKLNPLYRWNYHDISKNQTLVCKKIKTITEESFWKSMDKNVNKPNQMQRYEAKNAPEYIKKFIAIGGGPKMGGTLEKYARFHFQNLKKRNAGKEETGYDHILEKADGKRIYIEQKSSGHWDKDDFKWQHVVVNHKWEWLLLSGITYTHIRFWVMDRATFVKLIEEKKITNQGNKAVDSTQGKWFSYSAVKDSLREVFTAEDLENMVV